MSITLFFDTPGTYTIEDDGIRGNNISVVRNSSGTVVATFLHPADAMNFVAQVPGITFVLNTADSFGSAEVTLGSLSGLAGLTPDAIVVRQFRSDDILTLAATGSISEGPADAAADIVAAGVAFSAGTGVGTPGNAIETQVTFIEAETNTGGINLANIGQIQVGGVTPEVSGLQVFTSGDIRLSTVGSMFLNDISGGAMVNGGPNASNVTLTAIGALADWYAVADQPAIHAPGGSITITTGRDVLLGPSGMNFDNDVLATGDIRITAGGDVRLDGTSDIQTGAFGGDVGGLIDIRAGHDILLENTTGGLQSIVAFAGDVLLTTGPGGALIVDAAMPSAIQTTDDIVVTTDRVRLNSGGLDTVGNGSVTIRTASPGLAIDIGGIADPLAALALSDAELDRLRTVNLVVGDANSGPVVFSAPIALSFAENLTVHSSSEILVSNSITLGRSLVLRAGDDLVFATGSSFTSGSGGFTGFVDTNGGDGFGGFGSLGGTLTTPLPVQLIGNADRDTLFGSAGNDILDGGAAADTMSGAGGDDWFIVDNAADAVIELAGMGNDRVFSSTTYTLGAGRHIEMLTTTDSAATTAINLTGNELANFLAGNAGTNTLNGGVGADTLSGQGGDDWYFVDNAADVVIEGGGMGTDRVFASVSYTLGTARPIETLSTTSNGGTTAIDLTGNEFGNSLVGNAGSNVLDGKGAADVLNGFGGADTFRFTTALGGGNVDAIQGYNPADDVIQLENAVFTGLAPGALAAGAFVIGAAATDADDRIIYNSTAGTLLFDADGTGAGAAVQFATINAGLALTASEFLVI